MCVCACVCLRVSVGGGGGMTGYEGPFECDYGSFRFLRYLGVGYLM